MGDLMSEIPTMLFNSPVEIALRALFLLAAFENQPQSIQSLVYYDYLMIHSADVEGGPVSIHPPVPNRTGEWLIRRELLEVGLGLLVGRELARLTCGSDGLYFQATELTSAFSKHFRCEYAEQLANRASWVFDRFGHLTEEELSRFMTQHIATWGINKELVARGKIIV